MKTQSSNIVSIDWLKQNLDNPHLIVLDATMKKQANGDPVDQPTVFIPKAQSFNFDTEICDQNTSLPHMLCSASEFETHVKKLGINKNSIIVIYDAIGIFSSPRAWWMFKVMGYDNVCILNGGLPCWLQATYSVEKSLNQSAKLGDFKANFKPDLLFRKQQIVDALNDNNIQIIDARSRERFFGDAEEPRAGLSKGHIPNSYCLPYLDLLNEDCFKDKEQLKKAFDKIIKNNLKQLVFSCGSGVTACILALAASECGYEHWSIYDGSWSEWGMGKTETVTI